MKPTIHFSIRNTPFGSFCFFLMQGGNKIAESVDFPTHEEVCTVIREIRAAGQDFNVVDATRDGKLNPYKD